MKTNTIRLAGFLGVATIFIGAFGAHGLKLLLEPEQLSTYQTGVLYQAIHTLAIFAIGLSGYKESRILNITTVLFFLGILLFSGSLYLLSCRNILGLEHWTFLGPVTPIGGLLFATGWFLLLFIRPGKNVSNR